MSDGRKRDAVGQWIDNSARHHLKTERDMAARCAKAYKTEPYHSAASILAKAHDECAAIWRAVLERPFEEST